MPRSTVLSNRLKTFSFAICSVEPNTEDPPILLAITFIVSLVAAFAVGKPLSKVSFNISNPIRAVDIQLPISAITAAKGTPNPVALIGRAAKVIESPASCNAPGPHSPKASAIPLLSEIQVQF